MPDRTPAPEREPEQEHPRRSEARAIVGSWLQGPAATNRAVDDYPGRRLGLPQSGPGSVARFGRRFAALCLDWLVAVLVARSLFGAGQWAPLAVFAVAQTLGIATVGASLGHWILGLRVVRLDGTAAGPARALGRSLLLALAIPGLVWDRDQRGLHDQFIGTVLRRVTPRGSP